MENARFTSEGDDLILECSRRQREVTFKKKWISLSDDGKDYAVKDNEGNWQSLRDYLCRLLESAAADLHRQAKSSSYPPKLPPFLDPGLQELFHGRPVHIVLEQIAGKIDADRRVIEQMFIKEKKPSPIEIAIPIRPSPRRLGFVKELRAARQKAPLSSGDVGLALLSPAMQQYWERVETESRLFSPFGVSRIDCALRAADGNFDAKKALFTVNGAKAVRFELHVPLLLKDAAGAGVHRAMADITFVCSAKRKSVQYNHVKSLARSLALYINDICWALKPTIPHPAPLPPPTASSRLGKWWATAAVVLFIASALAYLPFRKQFFDTEEAIQPLVEPAPTVAQVEPKTEEIPDRIDEQAEVQQRFLAKVAKLENEIPDSLDTRENRKRAESVTRKLEKLGENIQTGKWALIPEDLHKTKLAEIKDYLEKLLSDALKKHKSEAAKITIENGGSLRDALSGIAMLREECPGLTGMFPDLVHSYRNRIANAWKARNEEHRQERLSAIEREIENAKADIEQGESRKAKESLKNLTIDEPVLGEQGRRLAKERDKLLAEADKAVRHAEARNKFEEAVNDIADALPRSLEDRDSLRKAEAAASDFKELQNAIEAGEWSRVPEDLRKKKVAKISNTFEDILSARLEEKREKSIANMEDSQSLEDAMKGIETMKKNAPVLTAMFRDNIAGVEREIRAAWSTQKAARENYAAIEKLRQNVPQNIRTAADVEEIDKILSQLDALESKEIRGVSADDKKDALQRVEGLCRERMRVFVDRIRNRIPRVDDLDAFEEQVDGMAKETPMAFGPAEAEPILKAIGDERKSRVEEWGKAAGALKESSSLQAIVSPEDHRIFIRSLIKCWNMPMPSEMKLEAIHSALETIANQWLNDPEVLSMLPRRQANARVRFLEILLDVQRITGQISTLSPENGLKRKVKECFTDTYYTRAFHEELWANERIVEEAKDKVPWLWTEIEKRKDYYDE